MSHLKQIQATVQQVAEAISSALDMDVTIVDDSMVRIAGTGLHKDTIGEVVTGNSLYHTVIANSKEYVIDDVKTQNECENCDQRATCMELAQLCCPIVVGISAIGVIGLIAFSHEQQIKLHNRHRRLLPFIRKMAELIAAKAVEEDSLNRQMLLKKQLETLVNFIAEGILAIDSQAKIININYAAEKMLGLKASDVIGFHISEVLPGTAIAEILRDGQGFMNRQVSVWHRGKHYNYLINAQPMLVEGIIQGVVASFRTIDIWTEQTRGLEKRVTFDEIIGSSQAMEMIKQEARKAAASSSAIMITGESGTGKELFARAIHSESERGSKPFVAVNCAAIPDNLLESELFGYEEGAFTGARKGGKPGKFQMASSGTVFLDEIGDMPLALQAKLLRVLQERVIEKVGGIREVPVDIRIIAATHQNLEEMVRQGKFREDLYYRLNVFPLMLPALRERGNDVIELATYFLNKHVQNSGKKINGFSKEANEKLRRYRWPGNIRELENAIECAVIRANVEMIEAEALPARLGSDKSSGLQETVLEGSEKQAIIVALQKFGVSVEGKKQAADYLGIGIATLYRKLRIYDL